MSHSVADDEEEPPAEEGSRAAPGRLGMSVPVVDKVISYVTRDGRGLRELTWADARSVLAVVNISLQILALFLVMGRGAEVTGRQTRKFRCILNDEDAHIEKEVVNISSCQLFHGRPVRDDIFVGVLGKTVLITYLMELVMNLVVRPRRIIAFICLSGILIWALYVTFITDSGVAWQPEERFLRLMTVSLFGVIRYCPVGGTFFKASSLILRALIPLLVFVLVAAVASACVMGLDGIPHETEQALVKVIDSERPQQALFSVTAADFCERSGGCYSQPFFANFATSIFTMFQMLTGDGWASDIAWPTYMFHVRLSPSRAYLRLIALASFVGFHTLIIGNFVTAVIVEAVLEHTKQGQSAEADSWIEDKQAEEELQRRRSSPGACGEALVAVRQLAAQLVRLEAKVDQLKLQRG